MTQTTTHKLIIALTTILLLAAGVFWWKTAHERPRLVYTSEGFGGFVPTPTKAEKADQAKEKTDPLKPAVNATALVFRVCQVNCAFAHSAC